MPLHKSSHKNTDSKFKNTMYPNYQTKEPHLLRHKKTTNLKSGKPKLDFQMFD